MFKKKILFEKKIPVNVPSKMYDFCLYRSLFELLLFIIY